MRNSCRVAWCAAACLLGGLCAYARPTRARPAPLLSPFEHAEHLHATLEEQPQEQRTRGGYERVLAAYRSIYHDDPASSKADASISAVAGLLAEEGRLFHSGKALHDAIAQYEFLRGQYPLSRYRFSALLAEGEIYHTDLQEQDQANAAFQEFVETYPRNPLARQARIELKEIHEEQGLERRNGRRAVQNSGFAEIRPEIRQRTRSGFADSVAPPVPRTTGDAVAEPSLKAGSERQSAAPVRRSQVFSAVRPPTTQPPIVRSEEARAETSLPAPVLMSSGFASDLGSSSSSHRRRSQVTAIRDWSTADYTRIAINLDDQVEYQSARVSHPDRIYFDLRDAHLSPELAGKSMTVTDGGFLQRIRAAQYSGDITRIVLDVGAGTDYSAFFLPNPWRLIIDIHGHKPGSSSANETASLGKTAFRNSASVKPGPVIQAADRQAPATRSNALRNENTRNELDALAAPAPSSLSVNSPIAQRHVKIAGPRTVSSGVGMGSLNDSADAADPAPDDGPGDYPAVAAVTRSLDPMNMPPMREAQPAADGDRSLARTLGLKIGRIVIDAGHGGHDSGTLGPGGIQEKDITLDVALRLGRLLKRRLGEDVIFTRDDDTFIPLEMRTAIANRSHADLFISIHANSSSDPAARGVESYYLNFTTSPEALEVAARENAASDESIYQLSDLVKKITLRDKIEESREFAEDVQESLYTGLEAGNPGLKDRGVKKAPFMVLIGANMPSILAEISFLTNPDDARELREPAYRERIAESLYRGVARYIYGLNGIRLAQNGAHPGN